MSINRPKYDDRRAAIDRLVKDRKAHLEAQGKQPTQREVEKYVKDNAEKADRKNGW